MVQYSYDRYGRPIKWNVEWQTFDDDHREDLFHSTVGIQESTCILRTCNLIIDHQATLNLVSAEVVDNFKLPVITHPYPYSFGWFKDGSKVKVTKQVLIHLTLGNFTDQVLCDIVPMKVHHLLLGMPWLDEKCVMYDGSSTRYYIDINGKRTRFASMTQQRAFQNHKAQEVRDAHRENALRDEIEKQTTIGENVPQLLITKSVCDDFSLENEEKGVAINSDEVHDPVISTPKEFVETIKEENESVVELAEEISHIFVDEKVEMGAPEIVDEKVNDDRPDEEDTGLLDTAIAAPILPLICLNDPVHINGKPTHTFHDPFAALVDNSPALNPYDYISDTPGIIDFYIKPSYTFNIDLVQQGSRHQHAIHSKMCVRFIFDPGVRLVNFRNCSRLVHDSDRYDILLIRGRILSNREGMI